MKRGATGMSGAGALRLKLIVAYDGGPFRGWQSQSGGNTVQDHLEAAFRQICGDRRAVHGAGRTDAGVHALRQCAHIDVPAGKLPLDRWGAAINANLPREIRVLRCTRAAAGFHARFSATGKVYTYRIWNDAVLSPFELGRAWHTASPLDLAALRLAAERLTGRHDFAGFAANCGKPNEDTVRAVQRIRIKKVGASLLTLQFTGEGFLYKMVRLMTGTMVRYAQGRARLDWIEELLAGKGKTSFAAPAEGLYLTRVIY